MLYNPSMLNKTFHDYELQTKYKTKETFKKKP